MVRLTGPDSGKGAAGHWVDYSTSEHGDLLDLIARTAGSTPSVTYWTRRAGS
jgi:hypothetical protein